MALTVVIAVGIAGCNGSDESDSNTSATGGNVSASEAAGPAPTLDCDTPEDERGTSRDLDKGAHTERSPGAALVYFLLKDRKAIEAANDFEQIKREPGSAEFAYEPDSERLARVHVDRIDGGWIVSGYVLCRGAL